MGLNFKKLGKDIEKGVKSVGKEIGKGIKSVGKEIGKGAKLIGKSIENASCDNICRTKKCFEAINEKNIKIYSQKTGDEIKSWQDFLAQPGAYIYKIASGNYDVEFCVKKAFKKRGYVPCNQLDSTNDEDIVVNTFISNECFDVLKQDNLDMCISGTNTHIVHLDDAAACIAAGNICQQWPASWSTEIYGWDGTYNSETCINEFSAHDFVPCAGAHTEL